MFSRLRIYKWDIRNIKNNIYFKILNCMHIYYKTKVHSQIFAKPMCVAQKSSVDGSSHHPKPKSITPKKINSMTGQLFRKMTKLSPLGFPSGIHVSQNPTNPETQIFQIYFSTLLIFPSLFATFPKIGLSPLDKLNERNLIIE